MEYAAIAAGFGLIAYGVIILRRPWDWYLANEEEPPTLADLLDRSPIFAAAKAQRRAYEQAASAQQEYLRRAQAEQRRAFELASKRVAAQSANPLAERAGIYPEIADNGFIAWRIGQERIIRMDCSKPPRRA